MTLGSHFLYGHLNIQCEMNLIVSFCGSVFKNRTDKQLCDMARTNKQVKHSEVGDTKIRTFPRCISVFVFDSFILSEHS